MSRPELPTRDNFAWPVEPFRPLPYPPTLSDRLEKEQTVLVGPRGEPLLVRKPVQFGFRPDRAK